MKKKKVILFLACLSLCIWSCEKEVEFNLEDSEPKLVVEGSIEEGLPPIVILTKSLGFFSKIDLSSLENSFLHGAEITVSDDQNTVVLKEYEIRNNGFSYFIYSVDSSDINAMNFLGTFGKEYHLNIKLNNKEFTASTSIPFPKPFDSLWSKIPDEAEMPEDYPDSRLLYAQFTDPDTLGNYFRFFTKRNSEDFLAPLYSTYNDEISNGTKMEMQINSGFQRGDSLNRDTYGYFYKGDTVVVKWSAIDKNTYYFWNTLEFSSGTSGNPFAAPIKVTSNIKGDDVLGIWGGYGSVYDTLIIQE